MAAVAVRDQGVGPAGIYLIKVDNENTRPVCQTYSEPTIKTPEERCPPKLESLFNKLQAWPDFEQISHILRVFLLLILNFDFDFGRVIF